MAEVKERLDSFRRNLRAKAETIATDLRELQQEAKEKAGSLSDDFMASVERLAREVDELQGKLKQTFTHVSEELETTAERLAEETRTLLERARQVVPLGRRGREIPVRVMPGSRQTPGRLQWRTPGGPQPWPPGDTVELRPQEPRAITPPVDLVETATELRAWVDLPGVDPEKIEVTVVRDLLTIQAEKSSARMQARREPGTEPGRVCLLRRLRLPVPVDTDGIAATYRAGVLVLTMPKVAGYGTRKIAVTSG